MKPIHVLIALELKRRKLSQSDLLARLPQHTLAWSTLSMWLRGEHRLGDEKLRLILEALHGEIHFNGK